MKKHFESSKRAVNIANYYYLTDYYLKIKLNYHIEAARYFKEHN